MNRSLVVLVLSLVVACVPLKAPSRPLAEEPRSYRDLQGSALSVVLVDADGSFTASPGTVDGARAGVVAELERAGVHVTDDAPRRLVLELRKAAADSASMQQCVQVMGRLEQVSEAYLAGQPVGGTRCAGQSAPARTGGDALSALWEIASQVVKAAQGVPEQERARALFLALEASLQELDSRTSH